MKRLGLLVADINADVLRARPVRGREAGAR